MNNEPKAVKATRKDMAEQARKHYDEVSTEAMEWNSLIPQAIDAWEHQPELLEQNRQLLMALKRVIQAYQKPKFSWLDPVGITSEGQRLNEIGVAMLKANILILEIEISTTQGDK